MKLSISVAFTFIYIGYVLPAQVLAQTEHVLPVTALKARKDTTMLCLAGCDKTGNNAWNQSRENAADAALKRRARNSLKLIYFIMQPLLIRLVCVAFPVERIQRVTYNRVLRVFGIYYKRFRCIQIQHL